MINTLSQDDVDVLLHRVDQQGFNLKNRVESKVRVVHYDLANQERRIKGRMPILETINQQFSDSFSASLFNFLKKPAEISTAGVKIQTFSDYIESLTMPSSLHVVGLSPLKGRALIVFESRLIFTVVDNFFGGSGQFFNKADGRSFSPTEKRIIDLMIDLLFNDLQEAWKPVTDIKMDILNSEIDPQLVSILNPSDLIVVSTFIVKLKGGGGKITIALSYAMIEPIKTRLETTVNNSEIDKVWQQKLRKEVLRSEIPVKSVLVEKKMTIQDVINFQVGDVISIDMPEIVTVQAENVAIFKGKIGLSDGNYAIQVTDKVTQNSFE